MSQMGFLVTDGPLVVLGAGGRIGGLLRALWQLPETADQGGDGLRWQLRRATTVAGRAAENRRAGQVHILDPLADPDGLVALSRGAATVLCLAGPVPGGTSGQPDQPMSLHGDLACAAIRAAAAGGVGRVLLASSAAVYGAPGLAAPFCETDALRPLIPYGRAKAEMEERARQLGQQLGVQVCALRIGNIAGFDACLGGWRPGFTLDRFADGSTPRRSYIGVLTLARVLAVLAGAGDLPEAVNIAQPGLVAMGDLLRAADLPHDLRAAPETALARVELDVSVLKDLLRGAGAGGDPLLPALLPPVVAQDLVAQWRTFMAQRGAEGPSPF